MDGWGHDETSNQSNEKNVFVRSKSTGSPSIGTGLEWGRSMDELGNDIDNEFVILPTTQKRTRIWKILLTVVVAFVAVYTFLVAMVLLRQSILLIGGRSLAELVGLIDNPVAGLMVGICATVIVQSSSTTIAIVIGLVSVHKLSTTQAIPVIMGANIGTSVTNTIVSMSQIKDKEQFRRAFAGATVHDMFNILSVIVFLPIEVITGYLEWLSHKITDGLIGAGSKTFTSPFNFLVEPLTDQIIKVDESKIEDGARGDRFVSLLEGGIFKDSGLPDYGVGTIVMICSLLLLVLSLLVMVKGLSSLVQGKSQVWLKKGLNMNGYLALLLGILVTMLVQSSSITTSTLVPLVGLDLITLEAMYPLTLGTNIGVTITIILAALVTESKDGVQLAMAHLIYNISAILLFFPIPITRSLPLYCARTLGDVTIKHRWFALFYIITVFFFLPSTILAISLAGSAVTIGVLSTVALIILILVVFATLRRKKPMWLPPKLRDLSWITKHFNSKPEQERQRLLDAESDE